MPRKKKLKVTTGSGCIFCDLNLLLSKDGKGYYHLGPDDERIECWINMEETAVEKETKTCSICQIKYTGFGNNADPVNEGFCCDDCNYRVVIPARFNQRATRDKK
jgi:hypothetical protein